MLNNTSVEINIDLAQINQKKHQNYNIIDSAENKVKKIVTEKFLLKLACRISKNYPSGN